MDRALFALIRRTILSGMAMIVLSNRSNRRDDQLSAVKAIPSRIIHAR
jgi:hypothetical protein